MSYIYVITNKINGKQYVGQTSSSLEERFKQHVSDSHRRPFEKRPLYDAMNKYGSDNFSISLLEECPIQEVDIKEIYWIGKLDTYKKGYNATLGGEGTPLYNYEEIAEKYKELQNQTKTAHFFNCSVDTVKTACMQYNIPLLSGPEIMKKNKGKKILLVELNKVFESIRDAGHFLQQEKFTTNSSIGSITKNIVRACDNEQKTAYKFHWKFL